MPSMAHEILVDLFKNRPSLAAEILVEVLGVSLPAYTEAGWPVMSIVVRTISTLAALATR